MIDLSSTTKNQNEKGDIMDIIVWIQNWYKNNYDGDWEHLYGTI